MIDFESTICAISTPAGVGGIAVARISGPQAIAIADSVWQGTSIAKVASHTAHLGYIVDSKTGAVLDQAVATVFRAPKSYTGDDVVELSIHGSQWIQSELISLLIRMGCRLAEPGEFSRRAFAAGRMDLTEVEAVADLIASTSRAAHTIAMNHMRGGLANRLAELRDDLLTLASLLELELDFSEEDVEFASRTRLLNIANEVSSAISQLSGSFATGQAIKNGIPVAIVGATNAGKSTLLNRLVDDDRAIVSDIHGTTRDTIEETMQIQGILFRFIDTAGLRTTDDPIEALGINRSLDKLSTSPIVIVVIDPFDIEKIDDTCRRVAQAASDDARIILAVNKMDLAPVQILQYLTDRQIDPDSIVNISAMTGQGLDALRDKIVEYSGAHHITNDTVMLTNARHYQALMLAQDDIQRVIQGLNDGLSGDFIAQDLRSCLHNLGEITGTISTPEILQTIFSRFCIGK